MYRKSIRCLVLCLALVLGLFLTQALAADKPKDFPTKPVTIQVGFGAGGSSDVGVRILAEALKKVIGQPVLAENKPGAGGQVMWTDFKNNAKPDGYTLALVNIPQLQTVVFDPARKSLFTMKDFQPVANHVQDPGAVLVRKESPYKTLEDFLNDAKARPGQVKVSTTGIGSDDHLAVLDVQRRANVRFNIIHTQDTPTALTRALGGFIDVDFDNVGGFLPSVKSDLARILAVMMEQRYPDLPDVPTFKETGIRPHLLLHARVRVPRRDPDGDREVYGAVDQEGDGRSRTRQAHGDAGLSLKFMGIEEFGKFLDSQNERAKQLIELYRK